MPTRVAVHQPNFAPWLGYFDKMKKVDTFILMDTVQYVRRHICNRNKIKNSQGEAQWLTVPVKSQSREDNFLETRVAYEQKFPEKALQTLEHAYKKSPWFEQYFPALEALLSKPWDNLADLNIALIQWLKEILGIETKLVRMRDLPGDLGQKSEQIIALCRLTGGDYYLSGRGARAYNDPEAFAAAGIALAYQEFEHPVYPQMGKEFVSHLSALDLIFNCGPESPRYL